MPFVTLICERIVPDEIVPRLERAEDGAIAIFDGVVRNNGRRRRTVYLDYESYESMAIEKLPGACGRGRSTVRHPQCRNRA